MDLNYSQFHPLDHPIWHPYCWNIDKEFPEAPSGVRCTRLHFRYWREFMWDDPFSRKFLNQEPTWRSRLWALRKLLWW